MESPEAQDSNAAAEVVIENQNDNSNNNNTTRTPFTNLTQLDADLALARALQEQEIAYKMLTNVDWADDYEDDGEENESTEGGNNDDNTAVRSTLFREMIAELRVLARVLDEPENHAGNIQDTWAEVDPDALLYEELVALTDVVGTESRGLPADTIASLPSMNLKTERTRDGNIELCVICQLNYEDDDKLTVLPCKHSYHSNCLKNWLQQKKVCPVCKAEVLT